MPTITHHVCAECGKHFITDNAWIWCERVSGSEDDPYASLRVRAHFCCEAHRTKYLWEREGWRYDPLGRLVPPAELAVRPDGTVGTLA